MPPQLGAAVGSALDAPVHSLPEGLARSRHPAPPWIASAAHFSNIFGPFFLAALLNDEGQVLDVIPLHPVVAVADEPERVTLTDLKLLNVLVDPVQDVLRRGPPSVASSTRNWIRVDSKKSKYC